MAASITRYNFTKAFGGSYAHIDDSGRMPLAWLIGDTLANIMLADNCAISQIRLHIGSDYVTVLRQPVRISVFVANAPYSRRMKQ